MTELSPRECDIAIIGGGMVGASLAACLNTVFSGTVSKPRIVLIESFPLPEGGALQYQPSFDARSTAISVGSQRIFADIGVWAEMESEATAIDSIHVSTRGRFGSTLMQAQEHDLDALGHVLENQSLGKALLRWLRQSSEVEFLCPATVDGLKLVDGGSHLDIGIDGAHLALHCGLAVVADGAQSQLRGQLGIGSRIKDFGQRAIIANVITAKDHGGRAFERFTANGPIALLPLQPHQGCSRSALVWTLPEAEAERVLSLSDAEFLDALQTQWGYRLGRFLRAGGRGSYPLQLLEASEQARSGLVVMGNAAHFLHPVAGQGFNLALRDCMALAQCLNEAYKRGTALGELSVLEQYTASQRRDQRQTIDASSMLPDMFAHPGLALGFGRDLGLMAMDLVPGLRNWFVNQAAGLAMAPERLHTGTVNGERKS